MNELVVVQNIQNMVVDFSLMMPAGRRTRRKRRVEMQMQILAVILLDLLERTVQLTVREMWCG